MKLRTALLTVSVLLLPLTMSACSSLPKSAEEQAEIQAANDPFESVNRVVFDVNDFLDRLLIRPVTELYRFAVPDYVRERVANIVSNMGEPIIFANNLLQGETKNAGISASRLVINSTVGLAGMFEVAEGWKLPKQQGDFGQTLGIWGVGSGPYLVLPFFGPSNIRDGVGMGVDMVASPWQYAAASDGGATKNRFSYSSFAASGLTRREENLDALDALKSGSLDFYAEMRSVYRQYRDKQLGVVSNPSEGYNDIK